MPLDDAQLWINLTSVILTIISAAIIVTWRLGSYIQKDRVCITRIEAKLDALIETIKTQQQHTERMDEKTYRLEAGSEKSIGIAEGQEKRIIRMERQ